MSVALIIAAILTVLVPGGAKLANTALGGPPSSTASSSGTASADDVLSGPPSLAVSGSGTVTATDSWVARHRNSGPPLRDHGVHDGEGKHRGF